jgi:hypothetical protein
MLVVASQAGMKNKSIERSKEQRMIVEMKKR